MKIINWFNKVDVKKFGYEVLQSLFTFECPL